MTPRIRRCLSFGRVELLKMICGFELDCLLLDMNRVTLDFSSVCCETWIVCYERAKAAAV